MQVDDVRLPHRGSKIQLKLRSDEGLTGINRNKAFVDPWLKPNGTTGVFCAKSIIGSWEPIPRPQNCSVLYCCMHISIQCIYVYIRMDTIQLYRKRNR